MACFRQSTGITAKYWRRLATRGWFSILSVFLLALSLCFGLAFWLGIPQPRVHDEFSYLLASDTFSQARLSNATHPFWRHFETMHVLSTPNYASKYPPGQGMALALGVLLGHPILGVWLTMASASAALLWMLQAWTEPMWALTTSVAATLVLCTAAHPDPTLHQPAYWSQSYWGGGVAMLGGCLMFGGLKRFFRNKRSSSAMAFGVGVSLLAMSRPLEGLIVALPCLLIFFAIWTKHLGASKACSLSRKTPISEAAVSVRIDGEIENGRCAIFGGPIWILLLVLMVSFSFIATHNYSVTGSLLRLPYNEYESQFSQTPFTLLTPLADSSAAVVPPGGDGIAKSATQLFHETWVTSEFRKQQAPIGYLKEKSKRLYELWTFFVGPIFTVPLVVFFAAPKSKWTFFALAIGLAPLVFSAITPWMHPHYMGPVVGLVYLWIAEGLRWTSYLVGRGLESLPNLMRHTPSRLSVTQTLAHSLLLILSLKVCVTTGMAAKHNPENWNQRRAAVLAKLQGTPGKHLVLVHYSESHSQHREWVYNAADIDRSKVIWARDLANNESLLNYFSDRKVWLIHADSEDPEPMPLSCAKRKCVTTNSMHHLPHGEEI